ncbi:hypothetical protein B4U79_11871 [Dinothrombium tinctorium]|uniref:Copper transport protein n=1 Tax=Dinothrombium tinctorium TaxID=1965070 RepID=A0A3S3P2G7_9ACAR|nr:hypothetical protein B4U79_00981 [Dinothrombium tinctorium]RWS10590.1 hypothetical protein B4U79_11871 [Dinothrombium tinctorium]
MPHMYFHIDLGDTLYFKYCTLDNAWQTCVACLVLFVLATLYEGLKSYREYLYKQRKRSPCCQIPVGELEAGVNPASDDQPIVAAVSGNDGGSDSGSELRQQSTIASNRVFYKKLFNKHHLAQSSLHIVQVAVGYILMLGVMTFNIWICLAILAGAGLGYFLFCSRRSTGYDIFEHCN